MTARHARIAVRAATAERLEHAAAEAFEAGALGAEEHAGGLWIYLRTADLAQVGAALRAVPQLVCGAPEAVPERVWSEAWKEGLEAIVISERLLVRPSFRSAPPGFAGRELVIDPGQAFGTGGHASTRLALEAIATLGPAALAGARVLDVGCGSGVLALAALALGAGSALACDLDPLATAAAREAALANGLGGRLALFTGGPDALAAPAERAFDLVLANLIRRELEPLLPGLARALAPGGHIVLSGLLASEHERLAALLAGLGIEGLAARAREDPSGESWLSLVGRAA